MDIDLGEGESPRPRPPSRRRKSWLGPCIGIALHALVLLGFLLYLRIINITGLNFRGSADQVVAESIRRVPGLRSPQKSPAPPQKPETRPRSPTVRRQEPESPDASGGFEEFRTEDAAPRMVKEVMEAKFEGAPEVKANRPPRPAQAKTPPRLNPLIESLKLEFASKKRDYQATREQAKDDVLRAFEKYDTQVRESKIISGVNKHDLLMQIGNERARFRAGKGMPKSAALASAVIAYQRKVFSRRRPLLLCGESLIEAYTKERLDGEAKSLRAEIAKFEEEEGITHQIRVNDVWVGQRWFADMQPSPIRLRITARKGDAFSAEMSIRNGIAVARVEGICNGIDVKWKNVAMLKNHAYQREWAGKGVILGHTFYSEFGGFNHDLDNNLSTEVDGIMILNYQQ